MEARTVGTQQLEATSESSTGHVTDSDLSAAGSHRRTRWDPDPRKDDSGYCAEEG